MVRGFSLVLTLLALTSDTPGMQQPVPQPFPRAGAPAPQTAPAPERQTAEPASVAPTETPTEATLGLPIYTGAQFLSSYDAGRGQRYYLFGTNSGFADVVTFYRAALKERGELVFDAPATHMFEVGRFREETMAFPPGVTVKDYTWNNSEGYLHVTLDGSSTRYKTVIQMVPASAEQ